jgi:hypothetical protein
MMEAFPEVPMRPFHALALIAVLPAAAGDLEGFLRNLNVDARLDQNGFAARLSAQFQVSGVQVKAVLSTVKEPADAFMVLQLGQMTRQPHDRVLAVYKTHRHKGWGELAKELGIKPGSAEFHRLKRGDFRLEGGHVEEGPGKGKGKGHGKKH